jgi:hypothetical protein
MLVQKGNVTRRHVNTESLIILNHIIYKVLVYTYVLCTQDECLKLLLLQISTELVTVDQMQEPKQKSYEACNPDPKARTKT